MVLFSEKWWEIPLLGPISEKMAIHELLFAVPANAIQLREEMPKTIKSRPQETWDNSTSH